MLGDMDGNGLPDFLESTNTPYSEETTVDSPIPRNLYLTKLDSQGNVYFDVTNIFVGPPRTEAVYFNLFMDINGDGLSDWISVEGLTGYRLNKGGSFTEWRAFMGNWHLNLRSVPIVTGGEVGGPGGETIHGIQIYPRYSAAFRPYDFNADGKQELLIPGTHLAKACLDVRDNGVYERRCGDELYDVVDNAPGGAIEYGPPIPNIDDSIFQFNAVKFIEDADGIISAQVVNTPIIGSATQVASFDAYGNGLQDFIFTYGCRDHYNGNCELTEIDDELAGKDFGAYIMRNRGASSQADGYEPVDMLASVQNGLGVKDEWDYRPLSSTRYDTASDPYYERDTGYYDGLSSEDKNKYFNFSSSMYAVAEHRKSDGVGGLNSTRYRYKDAMFNREGRGFQGFRTITVDNPNGIRAVTDFHQVFPLTGQIEEARSCPIADSNNPACVTNPLTKKQVGYYEVNTTTYGHKWIIPAKSVETLLELNGRGKLSEMVSYVGASDPDSDGDFNNLAVSSSAYDSYGNILESTTEIDTGFGIQKSSTSTTYYPHDLNSWWINKLNITTKKINKLSGVPATSVYQAELDNDKTVKTTFSVYDAKGSRQPSTILTEPAGAKAVTQTLVFNDYGQSTSVTSSSVDEVSRTVTTVYTTDSYFAKVVTNHIGDTTTVTNPNHGQPDSVTDSNGLEASFEYDSFGRLLKTSKSGVPDTFIRYAWCRTVNGVNNYCASVSNGNVRYKVTSYSSGAPESAEYRDMYNRPLVTRSQVFNSDDIFTSVLVDELGRKVFESVPSASESSLIGTHYLYDDLGRVINKTVNQTDSQLLAVDYAYGYSNNPHRTQITVQGGPNERTLYRTYNGVGQLIQTTDALDTPGVTKYAYDGAGNPIVLQDASGASITATYNALSQKSWVDDPNMGRKDFTYTGYGEVESETDAVGNVIAYLYDQSGRLIQQDIDASNGIDEVNVFEFDNPNDVTDKCDGLPSLQRKNDGTAFLRTFHYNDLCQLTRITTQLDNSETFDVITQFDSKYGRPKALTYPNGLTVAYGYTSNGYLDRIYNPANNYTYRKITSVNEQGSWTGADLIDGQASTIRSYYA
ncbi:RHS repeat domain-containing protein, partial [Aliikangiella maris]